MVSCSGAIEVLGQQLGGKAEWIWTQHESDIINVNVDGSFLATVDNGGIGGVFWKFGGKILVQFDKEVEVELIVHAKLIVLREGLLIATTSR